MSDHVHVMQKQDIRLYKNLDFIKCSICGKSFAEVLREHGLNKQQPANPRTDKDN